MRKLVICLLAAVCFMIVPISGQAYTISDPSNDRIGDLPFESFGINVNNYFTGPISIELFTNYPLTGYSVSGWATMPADLFIKEITPKYGGTFFWAIPLVAHDGFVPGTMYAVPDGGWRVSDDLDPSGGTGYIYNHNVPVQMTTVGNNYGWTSFGGGTVTASTLGGNPSFKINLLGNPPNIYQDDPAGTWTLTWGTATCANDVVTGTVPTPIPAAFWLLGSGLLGLVGIRRRNTT